MTGRRTKRHVFFGGVALTGLALVLGMGCRAQDERPPNLLLIVVDTLRVDRLGAYGHTRDTSPAFDALAREATLFENAYSSAPWTKPAVASLLTGLHPPSHAATGMLHPLPESVETLAEILERAGYATGAVVSHKLIGAVQQFDQGFAHFDEAEARGHRHVSTGSVTDRALTQREQLRQDGRPYFQLVHYFDPHYDYMPHPEFGFAPAAEGRLRAKQTKHRAAKLDPPPSDAEVAFLMDLYDEEIRFTDDGIGRLIADLRERGELENTVIVVTADHGEEFFERGCIGHLRTLYDELVRVPLVVRDAGVSSVGRRVETPVSLVALPPTVLELLGIPVEAGSFEASSIAAWVRGETDPEMDPVAVYTEVDFVPAGPSEGPCPPVRAALRGVVQGQYKLVHDRLTDSHALYDRVADPAELRDVSAAEPEVLARLRRLLESDRTGRAGHVSEERPLDREQRELLEALGYIDP